MIGGLRVEAACAWCGRREAVFMAECGHNLCDFCGRGDCCSVCMEEIRKDAIGVRS